MAEGGFSVADRAVNAVFVPSSTEVVTPDMAFKIDSDLVNGVKPLFELDSSEYIHPCHPSHSWWQEGHLTVCFVHWACTNVGSPREFCELLSSELPSDAQFFACKRRVDGVVGNDYMAMLGFPYLIGSWKGLKDRLSLKGANGRVDSEKVFFYCVGSDVKSADDAVKYWSAFCSVNSFPSQRFTSSPRAFERPRYLMCAGDMWSGSAVE